MVANLVAPDALLQPFALNGDKNIIPKEATGTQAASLDEGFPIITSTSVLQGGIPPQRTDFNGLGYLLSSQFFYLQNGGNFTFNQTVSDAIGGYPQGAILNWEDTSTGAVHRVKSLIPNNTYNFVTTPSYVDGNKWEIVFREIPSQSGNNGKYLTTDGNNLSWSNVITGAATTIQSSNLTADRVLISNSSGKVAVSSNITVAELGYLDGVTSNIQTQLNAKAPSITGGASTIATSNLTASRALVSDGSGKVAVSGVTSTQLGYLSGVTSAIQTQLNGKVPNPSGNNTSWKITCSNGFKIQGGIVTTSTTPNYTYNVTFPTAFTSRPVILTKYLSTQGRGYDGLTANSNTGFSVWVTSASANYQQNSNGVAWVAFGI